MKNVTTTEVVRASILDELGGCFGIEHGGIPGVVRARISSLHGVSENVVRTEINHLVADGQVTKVGHGSGQRLWLTEVHEKRVAERGALLHRSSVLMGRLRAAKVEFGNHPWLGPAAVSITLEELARVAGVDLS